ncbi:hypothetical protein RFI_38090, partial [Reticulomyxa filosa]
VYQALFMCALWKEWDMRQWLSARQFFVMIYTLSKEKSAEQLHAFVLQIIVHNLSVFGNDDGTVLYDNTEKELCSAFDKFMLIPCLNYLALSKWVTQQKEFVCFSKMLQNINFKADKLRTIDEKIFEEVVTFDLCLRTTESHPNISIESYLVTLLQCCPQHTELTVQLLLNNTNKGIENQGLTRVLQLMWAKGEEDKKANIMKSLTSNILQLLLEDKKNRVYWIELLANSSMISNDKLFSKLLRDSLKNWLDGTEEKNDTSENVSFHSKVIELLSSDTFAKAKLYHQCLIESVHERDQLLLNNKKWTSEEIGKVNWELWQKILDQINNIPEVEVLDKKNVETASKNLCSSLEYCFECRSWFKQKNPMQSPLFKFFNQVLTQLIKKDNLLPIHVYEDLMQKWKDIEDIFSYCSMGSKPSLQNLEKIVNECRQFFELLRMFERIRSDYLFEHDLSDRLKELGQQNKSLRKQRFLKVKEDYKNELQLLKSYEQKMNIILERSQSVMFNEIWEKYNKQYESTKDQTPLFIFNKDFQNGSPKYQDLWWMFTKYSNGIEKCLINEMEYLFPEYDNKQRQEIANN